MPPLTCTHCKDIHNQREAAALHTVGITQEVPTAELSNEFICKIEARNKNKHTRTMKMYMLEAMLNILSVALCLFFSFLFSLFALMKKAKKKCAFHHCQPELLNTKVC